MRPSFMVAFIAEPGGSCTTRSTMIPGAISMITHWVVFYTVISWMIYPASVSLGKSTNQSMK